MHKNPQLLPDDRPAHAPSTSAPGIIIGAGLSGLYAAYLLHKRGVKTIVVEAKNRIGGRIQSINLPSSGDDREQFDMGPAWFWPTMNPLFNDLVQELELTAFEQYSQGDSLIEEAIDLPARAYGSGQTNQSASQRLEGGMLSMAKALLSSLDADSVMLNTRVTAISKTGNGDYRVIATKNNQALELHADSVITTIPLRLMAQSIQFMPELPTSVTEKMRSLPTWMAAHAKIMAIYPTPFWRAQGHSGSAMSYLGPLAEIHDASPNTASDQLAQGALFGFFGVNAAGRHTAGEATLKAMVIRQLTRLFGPQAAEPLALELQDWSREEFIATRDDQSNIMHPAYGLQTPNGGSEHPHLFFAGTEAATRTGGYLEGALEAAQTAVNNWIALTIDNH